MRKNIIRGPYFKNLKNKIMVFTGGTDGMGRIAVEKFAAMEATIFLLGRNEEKTKRVVSEIRDSTKNNNITFVKCDLSDLTSVRNAAKLINESCKLIDYLINCAGANKLKKAYSVDGFDASWAVNHLGPFLLTNLLLEKIKNTANARIVNLSSAMQAFAKLDITDLQSEKKYRKGRSYSNPKLVMIMWTRIIAEELKNTSVTINALNPGFISTNLLREAKSYMKIWILIMRIVASKAEVGANRIVTMALAEEYGKRSGVFVYEDYTKDPNRQAFDKELSQQIFEISKKQVGLT